MTYIYCTECGKEYWSATDQTGVCSSCRQVRMEANDVDDEDWDFDEVN